jgi:D-beta-D-heptose 7-phosphate kinase/D-beta-D-heptose 1-phosphate adenosyltransferase
MVEFAKNYIGTKLNIMTKLPTFNQAKILVVGDVMLDRYWYGGVSRISPEAPVSIVHVNQVKECAGGAGNVALNIVSTGARADLLGIIGIDEAGASLKGHLDQVHGYFQEEATIPTITKLRVISQNQQLIRIDFEESLTKLCKAVLEEKYEQHLAEADVVILSDYGKGTLSSVNFFIEKARKANKPVFVDPKGTDFTRYRGASLLTPNLKEFEQIVGHCETDEILAEKGKILIEALDLGALIVTLGSKGMMILRHDTPPLHLPAMAREVYDVTGAGDTVVAILACATATGCSLPDAAAIANMAAGIVVGHVGAASVTVQELEEAMAFQQTHG